MAARRLVGESFARGGNDNATALLAFLRPVTSLEQIYGGSRNPAGAKPMEL